MLLVFKVLIYLFALIAISTGLADLFKGLPSIQLGNGESLETGKASPSLDNAYRFLAGVWIGVGILFLLFVRDLEHYKVAMMVLLGVMAIGGIGRLLSLMRYGMPSDAILYVGLGIELILCPLMIAWLAFGSLGNR